MTTYISLLRGINVSGKNKIKMVDLVQRYQELGFTNVQSYIQSGNVIFSSDETNAFNLAAEITAEIKNTFNFDVPVLVLDKAQFHQIRSAIPFSQEICLEQGNKVMITFLSTSPSEAQINEVTAYLLADEQLHFNGNIAYMYCPNGYGKTKISNKLLERKLNASATTRNFKTVNKLCQLAPI